jgi:hypothetical protein
MIRLSESREELDQINFTCTFGALLFGVPSSGMNVKALATMIGHLPSSATLNDLDSRIGARLRMKQHRDFCKAFDFRDAILARFFELHETPTVRRVSAPLRLRVERMLLTRPGPHFGIRLVT